MSELGTIIAGTVSRIFDDHVTRAVLEGAEQGIWPTALWQAIEENGLLRPHLPESAGGSGGTWLQAFVVAKAAGRYTVPLPVAETLLAGWLLERSRLSIPEGPVTILPEDVPEDFACTAVDVPWGLRAPYAVGLVGDKGRVVLFQTAKAQEQTASSSIALEPRDRLSLDRAAVVAEGDAALPAGGIRSLGALLRSAQMAGALESILEQAVRYATERVQFGRPIAKFQAIQQELARLAGDVAAAGVAAESAFRAMARSSQPASDFDPGFEIAVAKTRVGEAVDRGTSIAHQTHGAIGFTYEHGLHFATRRLWVWRCEFGSDAWWAAWLGRSALARGADLLWPDITGRSLSLADGAGQ